MSLVSADAHADHENFEDAGEHEPETAAKGEVVAHPGNREVIIAKIVVLDTSALMSDPEGIFDAFPGADMVIPLTVVQELDGLKKRLDPGRRGSTRRPASD